MLPLFFEKTRVIQLPAKIKPKAKPTPPALPILNQPIPEKKEEPDNQVKNIVGRIREQL